MSTWILESVGRLSWIDARTTLTDHTCAWIDHRGVHTGEAPLEPPLTSHLWGWSDGHYVRLRIDDDHAHVGVLHHLTDGGRDGDGYGENREPVTVHQRHAIMAGHSPAAGSASDARLVVELLEVPGPGPVTFIRPSDRQPTQHRNEGWE